MGTLYARATMRPARWSGTIAPSNRPRAADLPEQIGMTIAHEYSIDGKNWQPLEHGKDGVEIISEDDETPFRIPGKPTVLVRSYLVANAGEREDPSRP